jgi:PAS domain S-box-containing protein
MKRLLRKFRSFYKSLGLVEQSQIVASTAVLVAMVTIIAAHFSIGKELEWLDFISIMTVGVIGYVSVYFTLKYGRQLEEQRRELLALNTITEAVNHSVELNYVLQSALEKVMELMSADCGWIYLVENNRLYVRHQYGTNVSFFPPDTSLQNENLSWMSVPAMLLTSDHQISQIASKEFFQENLEVVAAIPLERQKMLAGILLIASKEADTFEKKKIALIQAFGNQISVALHNASLFEQLKHSERQYADLYENSPDMYHSVDRNGTIVSCNITETQMLGYSKDEIIGKPLLRLYPQVLHEQVGKNLKSIFGDGRELKGVEEQIQKRDGTLVDVSVNTSVVYDRDGKPVLTRMVMRDITEKKKMETKILHAQKIDSVGNLAGGIAHDFNNILTSILGSASIMRRKVKDGFQWIKYVDLIETASRRGAALTRQLLTFARKDNPNIRLVDVNRIIEETIRLFEASASKSIQITTMLSPEPLIVEADEGQLQQSLLNLLLNARDAMTDGGTLSIGSRHTIIDEEYAKQFADGKPGNFVVVTVSDTGKGIPRHLFNRIFEPFFTTKEQGKGTGLGLSVVYGVIRSHNGYINVDSEVGVGSVFTIYLPRVMDRTLLVSPPHTTNELVGGTEHILLIEDEASVGEVGIDILEDLGYTVEIAHNGREALERIVHAPKYDLLILDMNMPQMGGKSTFEMMKKNNPAVKVLVCSGYSQMMVNEGGAFLREVDGFIQKPYELEDFARTVREILDKQPTLNT